MNTLSSHFFMEVMLKKVHSTVDKYATLNKEGDTIVYTLKHTPKVKRFIDLKEGQRIFEDLYGAITTRWDVTAEYAELESMKASTRKSRSPTGRRQHKGRA